MQPSCRPKVATEAVSSVRTDHPVEGVCRLTLCRPERRNVLSSAAMTELLDELRRADADEETGCVVIASEGPVFSSGHDLRELADLRDDQAAANQVFELCSDLMRHLVEASTPSIAMVQGLATAAGCQLVASCDLAVAADSAAFATPGVDIGLFCSTPAVAISRAVPRKRALEMLLTAERVPAATAAEIGLVNRVVPAEQLETETLTLARHIAAKPRRTVAAGKRAFARQAELGLEAAYEEMSRAMACGLASVDADEGLTAFLEKRHPRWNHAAGRGDHDDEP